MKTGMMFGAFMMSCSLIAFGQASQEVPGDDFSLEGALDLFKKSASPEAFERSLNSADSKVNNLDLNGDGDIDYIKVIDRNDGNVHAFILQAVISNTESQDVAVIELEKQNDGKAVLQIVGDADVYGTETIIEPTSEVRVNAGTSTARVVDNVWAWPSVQYVYGPYYSPWVSPWGWAMRPVWWSPWRPVSFYTYNPWWQPYRPYYSVCYTHRIGYAQRIYRPWRTTSVVVYNRNYNQIAQYRSSHYNDNRNGSGYSRGNDVNRGRESRSSGYSRGSSYGDNRNVQGNHGYSNNSNQGRPSSQGNSSTGQSLNSQPDWRNSGSSDQRSGMQNRPSFNDMNQMNRQRGQINTNTNRNTFSQPDQNFSHHGMSNNVQRTPQASVPRMSTGSSRSFGSRQNFEGGHSGGVVHGQSSGARGRGR